MMNCELQGLIFSPHPTIFFSTAILLSLRQLMLFWMHMMTCELPGLMFSPHPTICRMFFCACGVC
jgi:hypothetical protein